MACKGKGKEKRKPKKDETEFNNKRINLRRFAYDIIKSTALRFHVPESWVAAWENSGNDYGYDDFCLAICRRIISGQISYRYRFHKHFSKDYESNKLSEPRLIGLLLQEVMKKEAGDNLKTPVDVVEFSLFVACELFLFLHSKTISMHPKQLATYWFKCYLHTNKKQFENAGGLELLYKKGSKYNIDFMNVFIDKFIKEQCLPYDAFANDPNLKDLFFIRVDESIRMFAETLCKEYREEIEEIWSVDDSRRYRCRLMSLNIGESIVRPPVPDQASGVNVPQNPGLGTIPPNKELQFQSPSVTSPPDPTAGTSEGQPQTHRALSCEEKISYNLLEGVKPKDRLQSTVSCGMRTDESSFFLSGEQGGELSSDSSIWISKELAMAIAETWQSYEIQDKDKSNVLEQNIGSSGLQRGESSVQRVEQGIGKLSLVSSEATKSDVLVADGQTSQSHSGANLQNAKQEDRESSNREDKRIKESN